ncbi:MAG: sensor histidine kinase [Nitrospiraceae bacterium]
MLKTLYGKSAAILFGLFCSVGVLYVLLTLFTTRMYIQEVNQKLNRSLAKQLVAENLLVANGHVNQEALKEVFHILMVINPNIEAYLLDANGTIQAFSAPPGKVKRRTVSLEPVKRFLNESGGFPILGDDPRDLNQKKIFSASLVPAQGQPDCYLYVVLGGEEYDSVVTMLQGSYILRLSLWASAIGLLFALAAGLLLFNVVTRKVRQLVAAADVFEKDDFCAQIDPASRMDAGFIGTQGGDEIDRLGMTYDRMARRITQQLKKLKQNDTLRRELVANVSHDLRTPLASLQGYLETLQMKEDTLTEQERRRFLEIATQQSERLGNLVSELFELAKLDSQEMQLHCEPFSLGELVQDVTQKFQLTAEKRQIRLQTDFRADLPFVFADIGMIERALQNVIENALRYTSANGTVTVALISLPDAVTIRVTDTGCGIHQDDLPHIFDRFYRSDKQRRSDGTGLGLAITARILELHGSSIEVSSTIGRGTTLTFQLPTTSPKSNASAPQ